MVKSAIAIFTSLFLLLGPMSAQAVVKKPVKKTLVGKNTGKLAIKPVARINARHGRQPVQAQASHVPRGRQVTHASLDKREKLVRRVSVVRGRRQVTYARSAMPSLPVVPPVISAGELAGLNLTQDPLALRSNVAYVIDQASSKVLFEKNPQVALPIASVTKLMTAVVVVEAHQNMNEVLTVTEDDVDSVKHSSSRLRVGAQLTRDDMLHIALMSSENRAASALGRNYPGGLPAFVAAMNMKAHSLGMQEAHYVDSTGLSFHNVASARDLAKLAIYAYQYPIIRQYSTDTRYQVEPSGRPLQYASSNRLTANKEWDIGLQKTGYINEAGHCLVMLTRIEGRSVVMVFLDSKGNGSHVADATRMRKWLSEQGPPSLTRVRHDDDQG